MRSPGDGTAAAGGGGGLANHWRWSRSGTHTVPATHRPSESIKFCTTPDARSQRPATKFVGLTDGTRSRATSGGRPSATARPKSMYLGSCETDSTRPWITPRRNPGPSAGLAAANGAEIDSSTDKRVSWACRMTGRSPPSSRPPAKRTRSPGWIASPGRSSLKS